MMFSDIRHRFKNTLSRYAVFARIFEVLERTPAHATHWYAFMMFGFSATLVSVGIAWFVFTNVTFTGTADLSDISDGTTIQRDELREAVDIYRARSIEFQNVQQNAPRIIDPGR